MIFALLVGAQPHHHHDHAAPIPASAPADGSIYNLEQTWTDDNGKATALASLRGRPLVVVMVYTTCQAACPLLVTDMKRIETALPPKTREQVRFAVLSFDPARDDAARLKAYRRERTLAKERWTLLRASADTVRELAAVLGVKYKPLPNGDFQHSNVISIIDADGIVRRQISGIGENVEPTVSLLTDLVAK